MIERSARVVVGAPPKLSFTSSGSALSATRRHGTGYVEETVKIPKKGITLRRINRGPWRFVPPPAAALPRLILPSRSSSRPRSRRVRTTPRARSPGRRSPARPSGPDPDRPLNRAAAALLALVAEAQFEAAITRRDIEAAERAYGPLVVERLVASVNAELDEWLRAFRCERRGGQLTRSRYHGAPTCPSCFAYYNEVNGE
jgi:hypothetical protein